MNFQSANQYVVNSVVRLSEQRQICAAEDIFDDRGNKLWAKGNRISNDLQERLLQRKLAKPLETALTVENALCFADIVRATESLLADNPLLKRIAGPAAVGVLRSLESFSIPAPIRLLLTTAQVNNQHAFRHTMYTVLVAAGLATRLGASDRDAQTAAVAALLHDIGEMYINPDFLDGSHRLEPHQWKYVASHPRIGELLIREMTTLPAVVAQIVGQHHERLDGSGYPAQIPKSDQHRLSNWLAIADTTCAILAHGDAGAPQRVALALRIVPEEFDREAVATILAALRDGKNLGYGQPGDRAAIVRAQRTWQRIGAAIAEIDRLETESPTASIAEMSRHTRAALVNLEKSLRATGVVETDQLGSDVNDQELLSEIFLISREATWRSRNLARNIHLRAESGAHGMDNLAQLEPLIALLNDADTEPPAGAA